MEKTLRRLDKAVSLNIADLKLSVEESVIEQIAIARWSEQAFRQRGQWMHWYLRLAGAMELALLSYLVKFGRGFSWEQGNIGCGLVHERSTKPGRKFDLSVTWIASELLIMTSRANRLGIPVGMILWGSIAIGSAAGN